MARPKKNQKTYFEVFIQGQKMKFLEVKRVMGVERENFETK
jgi:hypothetical protein